MVGREDALRAQVVYPESDGKPMSESDAHGQELRWYVLGVLEHHFADQPLVYVSGNNFVYFREGDPKRCVSPDAYVVRGVAQRPPRASFKTWVEGRGPSFVLELTSGSTRDEDFVTKLATYRDELRVPEYFLFDLTGDWIAEKLRGYALERPRGRGRSRYAPIPSANDRLPSRELGLDLFVRDGHLRFARPGEIEPLLIAAERDRAAAERERTLLAEKERERSEKERERSEKERERSEKERAFAEVERLRAELERLRRPDAPGRADQGG